MRDEKFCEVAILTDEKQALVLNHRINALRMARSLLRRWNAFFDLSEVQSLSDITLCEAARNYDGSRGTEFTTYLFLYIKGALIREIKSQQIRKNGALEMEERFKELEGLVVTPRTLSHCEVADDEASSLERVTYQRELRDLCRKAISTLKPLERQTVIEVSFMGRTITSMAKRQSFSRPYLSAVHSRAMKKLHPLLESLAA